MIEVVYIICRLVLAVPLARLYPAALRNQFKLISSPILCNESRDLHETRLKLTEIQRCRTQTQTVTTVLHINDTSTASSKAQSVAS